MRHAFFRGSLRMVRSSWTRFLAIFAITMLGVSVFAGLRATAPDMRATAQAYFNARNLMDFHLLSTMGFTEEDVDALRQTKGVRDVTPGYSADAIVSRSSTRLTVKLLSEDAGASAVNRPALQSGRMPAAAGECLADERFMGEAGCHVGDEVVVSNGSGGELTGTLTTSTLRVVGVADTPLYISYDRGTSTIGTGSVDAYLLLDERTFSLPVYTDLYVTARNPMAISRFSDRYDSLLRPVSDALTAAGKARAQVRYDQLVSDGRRQVDEAGAQLRQAQQQLTEAAGRLAQARTQIADGRAKLREAWQAYDAAVGSARRQLDDAEAKLQTGEADLAARQADLRQARSAYDSAAAELEGKKIQAGLGGLTAAQLTERLAQMQAAQRQLPPASVEARTLAGQMAGLSALIGPQQQLESTAARLAEGREQVAAAAREIDAGKTQLSRQSAQFVQQQRDGQERLTAQQRQLDAAEAKLAAGEEEYARQQAEARPRMDAAARAIDDGEKALASLRAPEWYVLDLNTNAGFVSFKQDADRIRAVSLVFPLIFFLVAALVSLTAMTRLVEDDRTVIGTMKALGYGRGKIAARYLFFAFSASVLGSAAGLGAGYQIFPRVIFRAYRILYTMPDIRIDFNLPYAGISTAAAVFCAAVPACLVCLRSLRERPAALMRPRAPRGGRRILLERIAPLWKRLDFSHKVACRNLFRYKKRMAMTVAGVAGCTALLLTGFGLKDSISDIVGRQYGDIRVYDLQVNLKDGTPAEQIDGLTSASAAMGGRVLALRQESMDAVQGKKSESVYLVVPEDAARFPQFIRLHERVDRRALAPTDRSVVISEKLAATLSIRKGDTFHLRGSDGRQVEVKVGGVAENYIYHYVYMTPGMYRQLFGRDMAPDQLLVRLAEPGRASALASELMRKDSVSAVGQVAMLRSTFQKMIGALNTVVLVLILSAAALAMVVLISLTNINIDERRRELATLRVLGFYPLEAAAYIGRENLALTLLGTGVGLLFGIVLERYVITTVEVDLVMFGRQIFWMSYLNSVLLTFGFSLLVNIGMLRRVRRIDMVGSLKSNE